MTVAEIYKLAGVHRLPVDPIEIARALGVKVLNYKTAAELFDMSIPKLYGLFPLGFSFKAGEDACIALNENSCGDRRRRFTAAHELGHCVLGHIRNEVYSEAEERAAERFAAELLAPVVVLHECGVRDAGELSRVCGISRQAAELRLEELIGREQHGFRPDDSELRVRELFAGFIASYR